MTKVEKCKNYFNNKHNCAQAVSMSFAPEMGMSDKTVKMVSGGFGGGIAGSKQTCGALCGMIIAYNTISEKDNYFPVDHKASSRKTLQDAMNIFKERFGSTQCSELLNMQNDENANFNCEDLCMFATEITEKILDKHNDLK